MAQPSNQVLVFMNIVLPTVYLIISAIGIVGNVLVILVLRKVAQKSITDTLVQNLAVADLMFTLFLPFWAVEKYEEGIWRFGSFMCQFISFIFLLNLYASVYFLTALSVDRYYSVCYPIHSRKVRTATYSTLLTLGTWSIAGVLSVPAFKLRTLCHLGANEFQSTGIRATYVRYSFLI